MPRYRIPCWIDIKQNFYIEVDADTPVNALLNLHKLVESSDPNDIDYVEECVNSGEPDGYLNPIDFDDDTTKVEIVEN